MRSVAGWVGRRTLRTLEATGAFALLMGHITVATSVDPLRGRKVRWRAALREIARVRVPPVVQGDLNPTPVVAANEERLLVTVITQVKRRKSQMRGPPDGERFGRPHECAPQVLFEIVEPLHGLQCAKGRPGPPIIHVL